ncbi:hypothetical protein FACS189418_8640 [Clostridia bacterium]|nr:hypothetical protein FACS189418_8640 [Clostridia bacterium]
MTLKEEDQRLNENLQRMLKQWRIISDYANHRNYVTKGEARDSVHEIVRTGLQMMEETDG